jgi:uncharacterized BrkB/YihY/UPF0761 family membrane protein
VLGFDVANLLLYMLERISLHPSDIVILEWMVSLIFMFLGSSLLFFKLQYALNKIWWVTPSPKNQTKTFLLNRLFALLMVVFKVAFLFVLFTRFKMRARTATLSSLTLANFSEFGLIVGAKWLDD